MRLALCKFILFHDDLSIISSRFACLKNVVYRPNAIYVCFVWVWNMVNHIKGRRQVVGVTEQDAEKNIRT
jgi:hypothetical protein